MLSRWCIKVKLDAAKEGKIVGDITASYDVHQWFDTYTYTTYEDAEEACLKWRAIFPSIVYEPIFVEVEVEVNE